MANAKLKQFLDEHQIKYQIINHSLAYTAMEVAEAAKISGKEIAKTLGVKADGKMIMVVLRANDKLDMELLKKASGANLVALATEEELAAQFPDCELGAMPPFGNLYHVDVYVGEELAQDEIIAFNAGSHLELIQMSYADYAALVNPRVVALAVE